MKGFAGRLWTACMAVALLTGVQALSAGPSPDPDRRCYVCEWRIDDGDPYMVCFETLCSEVEP